MTKTDFFLLRKDGYLIGPFDSPGLAIRAFEQRELADDDYENLEGTTICLERAFMPRIVVFEHAI